MFIEFIGVFVHWMTHNHASLEPMHQIEDQKCWSWSLIYFLYFTILTWPCNQLRWVKSKVSFSEIYKWTSCVHQIQNTNCLKNYTQYCLAQPNSMIENRICLLYHALVISCQMINLFLKATVISSHLITLWKYS